MNMEQENLHDALNNIWMGVISHENSMKYEMIMIIVKI